MYEELVKSLRQCAEASCAGCKNKLVQIGCRGMLQREAADVIEELSHDYEKLAEEFNGAVELLHKRSKPHWIPVTKKPPLKVGDDGYNGYLVYANGFYEVADYTTDKLDDVPCFYVDGEYEPTVTHFMPLPEPPKEETE